MRRPVIFSAILITACSRVVAAQGSNTYDQTYLSASHNWVFRDRYPEADHLFNAFDYGHAILSETLLSHPKDAATRLDSAFAFISHRLLRHPPAVPLEEHAIAPTFTRLAPEVAAMFSWAHMLHRQIYDIWGDERIPESSKDAAVAKVLQYYQSRHDLALSGVPKSMALMDSRAYAGAFQRLSPKFNGLIWSYHWFQITVYDALLGAGTPSARHQAVLNAVDRFHALLDCAPERLPSMMPMSWAVGPLFARRYPTAAAIFDNLHALHDVVSDILASPSVPKGGKRTALLSAAAAYRDSTTDVVNVKDWRAMSESMGVLNMGGSAADATAGVAKASPVQCADDR